MDSADHSTLSRFCFVCFIYPKLFIGFKFIELMEVYRKHVAFQFIRTAFVLPQCEGEAKPRKKARLLNHFCPALMDVSLARRSGDKSGTGGRIHVTFYRTHIGHTPSPLDVKYAPTSLFLLDSGVQGGAFQCFQKQGSHNALTPSENLCKWKRKRLKKSIQFNSSLSSVRSVSVHFKQLAFLNKNYLFV